MKKYLISVNGRQYEVEVEEITGDSIGAVITDEKTDKTQAETETIINKPADNIQTETQPAEKQSEVNQIDGKRPADGQITKDQIVAKKTAEKRTSATEKTGSEKITCPMAGTILKVAVVKGQEVKKGQMLCVLEAMKMENDIVAPHDAIIAGVAVSSGASVNAGDTLFTLE